MDNDERDERLIRIDERVLRLVHVIEGNGQPGLSDDVARQQEKHKSLVDEVDEIKASVPGMKERRAGWIAISVAVLTGLINVLLNRTGE